MLFLLIFNANCYIASATGFAAYIAVILLSLKICDNGVRAYMWIINVQGAIETTACILAAIMNIVRDFLFVYLTFNGFSFFSAPLVF